MVKGIAGRTRISQTGELPIKAMTITTNFFIGCNVQGLSVMACPGFLGGEGTLSEADALLGFAWQGDELE